MLHLLGKQGRGLALKEHRHEEEAEEHEHLWNMKPGASKGTHQLPICDRSGDVGRGSGERVRFDYTSFSAVTLWFQLWYSGLTTVC